MTKEDWTSRNIENAERWLEEENDELPFLFDMRRKLFKTDRALSDKFAEAIASSEKAILSLKEELNGLYEERQRTQQDNKGAKAAGRLYRSSYGGARRTGLCAEDPDKIVAEAQRKDMGL
jgi:hypothetical protein